MNQLIRKMDLSYVFFCTLYSGAIELVEQIESVWINWFLEWGKEKAWASIVHFLRGPAHSFPPCCTRAMSNWRFNFPFQVNGTSEFLFRACNNACSGPMTSNVRPPGRPSNSLPPPPHTMYNILWSRAIMDWDRFFLVSIYKYTSIHFYNCTVGDRTQPPKAKEFSANNERLMERL